MLPKIPAAFFKSIEYTTIASFLSGGLAGVTLPEAERMGIRWLACLGSGSLVLAIQIDAVIPDNVMRTETDRMVRDIRETYEPMPGYGCTLFPGAIEEERMEQYQREGIRYGEMEQIFLEDRK